VKRKQERKRGQEREDPAGSFHNERHPLVCVILCERGEKKEMQAGRRVEEKGKTRQTEGIKVGFTLTFQ